LSTVWVIAQIYEKDFQAVSLGTPAIIATQAYPGRTFAGRVSYIDPRVDPQTRTVQVRIEIANPREVLRLGMFVDVNFGGAVQGATGTKAVPVVPRSAVQTIGGKQVVYVATDRPGIFVQREVSVGPEVNGMVPVYSGVSAGERVVTEGSFLIRGESLKLNPAQSILPASAAQTQTSNTPLRPRVGQDKNEVQTVKVMLTEKGFEPDVLKLRLAVPTRVTFLRKVEETCGTEVLIPEYAIKRELPFNEPVLVEFTPGKRGEFSFTCGMGMLRGKLIVR
jgi:hypothetical protein